MKPGVLFSIILGVLAACGMVMAFLTTASPYVTIVEARSAKGDGLHVIGDLDKSSLFTDLKAGEVRFTMADKTGMMNVIYKGPPPSNMGEATQVVAVGGMRDGVFYARELNLKCPSKYEGNKKKA